MPRKATHPLVRRATRPETMPAARRHPGLGGIGGIAIMAANNITLIYRLFQVGTISDLIAWVNCGRNKRPSAIGEAIHATLIPKLPTAGNEIIHWPPTLLDPRFSELRERVEGPYRRAPDGKAKPTSEDYQNMIGAAGKMRAILGKMPPDQYAEEFLNQLVSNARRLSASATMSSIRPRGQCWQIGSRGPKRLRRNRSLPPVLNPPFRMPCNTKSSGLTNPFLPQRKQLPAWSENPPSLSPLRPGSPALFCGPRRCSIRDLPPRGKGWNLHIAAIRAEGRISTSRII